MQFDNAIEFRNGVSDSATDIAIGFVKSISLTPNAQRFLSFSLETMELKLQFDFFVVIGVE